MTEIVLRQEALAFALRRYFTGKPCKHGHIAERHTKTRLCVECLRLFQATNGKRYSRRYRERNLVESRARAAARMREWRRQNPETDRAGVKRRKAARLARDPAAQRAKDAVWEQAYRERNPEAARKKTREYMRRWRATSPEAAREALNRFHRENPGRKQAYLQRRRARMRGLLATLSPAAEAALKTASTRCHYCGKPFNSRRQPELDHIMPLAKGGAHSRENVVVACRSCNGRKNATLFDPVTQQGILL